MSIRIDGKPLIPGLEALTSLVLKEVGEKHQQSLQTLVGHLDECDRGNLEAVLNYVRALAALPGGLAIRGIEKADLEELDAAICQVVRAHVDADLPDDDNPYLALALWIRAVRRLMPTQVFTTNYDLLMKQALERRRVAYFDGFMGSREPVFDLQAIEEDDLPSRWTLLWKLHGSINWSQDPDGNVIRRPADSTDQRSALVYPSHLKYDQSRRLPYLAMLDRLKAFLRKPGEPLWV
ncbi:SIR2 family protein [Arthrobacter sp. AET 35A]|uniref:SIR2 family protein n=1 Tax=Arthrobacter sp. AET 35A TaxID=2292643 RepID=UPI00177AF716|nr:SIR2 family protein [Arthrobacter sp. AET 35A]